jgi:hypothetical protein
MIAISRLGRAVKPVQTGNSFASQLSLSPMHFIQEIGGEEEAIKQRFLDWL